MFALSTDLEEATDYANPYVGSDLFMRIIKFCHHKFEWFPTGLALKAFNLLIQPGYILVPNEFKNDSMKSHIVKINGVEVKFYYIEKKRSWLMGDPLTKILLTFA